MQYGRLRRGFKLANCKFRIHQLLMKKKAILGGAAFLLILFVLSFFPTYSPGDSDREAALFADRYADGYDLSGARLVDRYEQNDEMFSLYRRKGTYFLVWAKKSLYPGRYRIEGGSGPGGQGGQDLNEFQKYDSSGFVYILYGPYRSDKIELRVETDARSSSIKEFNSPKDHTFVVYPNTHDVAGIEIL